MSFDNVPIESTMSGFTPVFDVIAQDPDLGTIAAVVFGCVWRYCQLKKKKCFAEQQEIADETGLSRKTVNRWLKRLCAAGYLIDTTPHKRGGPHVYRNARKVIMITRTDAILNNGSVHKAYVDALAKIEHRVGRVRKKEIKHKKKGRIGCVYLVRSGPFYKIGVSSNVDERIKQLSMQPPFDIELIHTIKEVEMYIVEKVLHNLFASKRKKGEWFELEPDDVEHIKGL